MLAGLVACIVAVAGCRREDVRTVVIRVPGMKNKACAERITQALQETRYGVRMDSLQTNLESRTLILNYDSMLLSLKNIEFVVAKAGFAANEVPADKAAAEKLPPECR